MRVWNGLVMSLTVAAGYVLAQRAKPGQAAYTYEKPVMLSGTMRLITFPGPPNYESVKKGDMPEHCFVLHLRQPISVRASKSGGNEFDTEKKNVTDVQLATSDKTYAAVRRLSKRQTAVRVTGTLFGEHTGHHHTPVLLDVTAIAETKTVRRRAR